MSRTIRILLAVSVAVALAAVAAWWADNPPEPKGHFRAENYPQVRIGLARDEVEKLLGGPPGNYGRYGDGPNPTTGEGYQPPPQSIEMIWRDDQNHLEIYFDAQNRVVGHHKRFGYRQLPRKGFFERSWEWLASPFRKREPITIEKRTMRFRVGGTILIQC